MKSISTFYDLETMDCVILHLPEKWGLYSQIYGGSRHDIGLEWFAGEKDNLTLERDRHEISLYKVYYPLLFTSLFE